MSSIRRRGFVRTGQIACSATRDFFFDLRHRTDTFRWVLGGDLKTDSVNKAHATHYQATKAQPFQEILRQLALPKDGAFVDLGSGKGRALLLAAMYGFRRVVGVEFSPQLCAAARANIDVFSKSNSLPTPIEIVEADVTRFPITPDLNVFYLYNPFDEAILNQVLNNLSRSFKAAPRPSWLIYNTPIHDETIHQSGVFPSHRRLQIGGTEFSVHTR